MKRPINNFTNAWHRIAELANQRLQTVRSQLKAASPENPDAIAEMVRSAAAAILRVDRTPTSATFRPPGTHPVPVPKSPNEVVQHVQPVQTEPEPPASILDTLENVFGKDDAVSLRSRGPEVTLLESQHEGPKAMLVSREGRGIIVSAPLGLEKSLDAEEFATNQVGTIVLTQMTEPYAAAILSDGFTQRFPRVKIVVSRVLYEAAGPESVTIFAGRLAAFLEREIKPQGRLVLVDDGFQNIDDQGFDNQVGVFSLPQIQEYTVITTIQTSWGKVIYAGASGLFEDSFDHYGDIRWKKEGILGELSSFLRSKDHVGLVVFPEGHGTDKARIVNQFHSYSSWQGLTYAENLLSGFLRKANQAGHFALRYDFETAELFESDRVRAAYAMTIGGRYEMQDDVSVGQGKGRIGFRVLLADGHDQVKGETSDIAVTKMPAELDELAKSESSPREIIARAINSTNLAIQELLNSQTEPEDTNGGTTLVGLIEIDNRFYVVNIGDSRLYRLRNGDWQQLTKDHSGLLEETHAAFRVSRSLGHPHAKDKHAHRPDIQELTEVQSGDVYLLRSDGIDNDVVSESQMVELLQGESDPARAAEMLIAAKKFDFYDNAAVAIVRFK